MLDAPKLPAKAPADGSPNADSPETGSGVPSTLKGGSDPSASLERKPSLKKTAATYSRVDSGSRMTVAFQEVVEEHDPVQEVMEAFPQPEEEAKQEVPEQLGIQPEMGLQEPEVVQTGLSLQEKEFHAVMDLPEQEDLHPAVGSQEQAPPLDEVSAVAATPESSPEMAAPESPVPIPASTEPAKPPAFEAPDIEVEGGLEDETGQEQHTTLAQDKIQILTKDSVSAWTLMRLMKVVRTRNLHMYSKSSLMEPDWEINSIPMATKAAKHIFKNVADKGQQELLLKNFMRFFPANKATQAFSTFEVTLNGTITKQGLLKWVLDVYKERKSLSLTLNDNRNVIFQINLLLDGGFY